MSISPITGPLAGLPGIPSLDALNGVSANGVTPTAESANSGFGQVLTGQVEQLAGMHTQTSDLAVQAATGDLRDIHDYMIAATQTQVATETMVALRNKGLEAFNDIMRMPL